MPVQAGFSRIAALLADPAREAMLVALADGRALPAGELARTAGISPQSASGHLRKLIDGGIVSVWSQGRFRYFRIANAQVAAVLETLATIAHGEPRRALSTRIRPAHLVSARCCYSHIAGRLGVALADALVERGYVAINGNSAALTDRGDRWAVETGLLPSIHQAHACKLRLCLDWTERRFHLAGGIASAILSHLLDTGCLQRGEERSLIMTRPGKSWFAKLGIEADDGSAASNAGNTGARERGGAVAAE